LSAALAGKKRGNSNKKKSEGKKKRKQKRATRHERVHPVGREMVDVDV
jgi:hypothetical protein